MSSISSAQLSEEQILRLLAAKRRTQRLQSLKRVARSARAAMVEPAGARQGSAWTDLPEPVRGATAIPLPNLYPGNVPASSDSSNWADDVATDALQPVSGSHTLPALSVTRLSRTPGAGTVKRWQRSVRGLAWGVLRDRALLLVELAAVAALLALVAGQFAGLGPFGPSAEVPGQAAPAPVAAAGELLPGASSPPFSTGAPAPLRPFVQAAVPVPIPTPGPQAAARIVIPAIDVDALVVEGDGWEQLKQGVGHHAGTPNPGELGNAVYAGHDDVYGEVFRRLEELKPGDTIEMHAGSRVFKYEVKRTRIVEAGEISVMDPTPDATLTLITCYPYRIDTHRLIVIGRLIG